MAPDSAAIQEALERIVASAVFAHSPRMSRFLRFVVQETVAGRSGDLKEYVVGVRVFDKTESYQSSDRSDGKSRGLEAPRSARPLL